MIRGSFDIRNSADLINNTAQGLHKKHDITSDNFNLIFNATMDARDSNMNDLLNKGKEYPFKFT